MILYIGFHSVIKVITSYIHDTTDGKPRYLNYLSTLEAIIGIGIVWAGFNMFFTDTIDYNTRYAIGGTFVIGFALIAFAIFDRMRAKVLTHMFKRDVYIRIITIIAIALVVGIVADRVNFPLHWDYCVVFSRIGKLIRYVCKIFTY